MTHFVYVTETSRSNPVRSAKAIREAARMLNPGGGHTLTDASEVMEAVEAEGYCLLGAHDDAALVDSAIGVLSAGLVRAVADPSAEALASRVRRVQARKMTRDGATPEEVFEEVAPATPAAPAPSPTNTALLLMAMLNGNPLLAAAYLHTLARTTGAADVLADAQRSVVATFPWIEESLKSEGKLL